MLKQSLARLGPIYGASFTYASVSSRYGKLLAGEPQNVFSLDLSGGSLVDIGVYPIALAVGLFGKPHSCTYKPVMLTTGADGGGHIQLDYGSFGVHINQSKCYASDAPSEVYGEKGTISMSRTMRIDRVDLLEAKTGETHHLGGQAEKLVLLEETIEFARIIEEKDEKARQELEDWSRIIIGITTDLRRQNGIEFCVEKSKMSQ